MDDLRNGLLPGRMKNEEEPGLFREGEESVPQNVAPDAEPKGPVDSGIVESAPAPARPATACRVPEDGSFGATLTELRTRHNFTIRKLAEETKIRESYLEALEAEDYDKLPQLVYVLGYIRKLCTLYGVSREDADALTAGLRERLRYELPEDLDKHTADRERSEEDEHRERQLLFLISGAVALVVLALIVVGVLIVLAVRNHGSKIEPGVPFNESLLVDLQPKPVLQVQELK